MEIVDDSIDIISDPVDRITTDAAVYLTAAVTDNHNRYTASTVHTVR